MLPVVLLIDPLPKLNWQNKEEEGICLKIYLVRTSETSFQQIFFFFLIPHPQERGKHYSMKKAKLKRGVRVAKSDELGTTFVKSFFFFLNSHHYNSSNAGKAHSKSWKHKKVDTSHTYIRRHLSKDRFHIQFRISYRPLYLRSLSLTT